MVILDDGGQQSTLHISDGPGADTLRIISLKRHGQLQQRDSARKHHTYTILLQFLTRFLKIRANSKSPLPLLTD
jgi:hypothetical protein